MTLKFRQLNNSSMTRKFRLRSCLQFVLILSGTWELATAQQARVYPLLQHKLLWADTVYREAIQKKDSLLLAESYYLYGKTYEIAIDPLTSQKWYLKSLAILEPRGYSFELARLYGRLAGNEILMNHYPESRKYIGQALAVARTIKNDRAMAITAGRAATFYFTDWSRGGKFPSLPKQNLDSNSYYQKMGVMYGLKMSKKDNFAKMELLLMQGYKKWDEKHDTAAIGYFKKSLTLAVQNNEPTWEYRILREMVGVYLGMDQAKNAWKTIKAAEHLLKASPFKDAATDQLLLEKCYRDYYLKIGNWEKAYEHGLKLHEMERNNYISDRDGAVTRLHLEYETEKKEARLKSQQRELGLNARNLKIQQRFLFALCALLVLASTAGFAFYRLYRKNQRMSLRNAELVREQNHRVKNNLQVVSSLLSLQSNRLEDEQARQAVEDSQSRVDTMAILHRHLYDGDGLITVDMKEFIPQIVEAVLQTYGFSHARTHFSIHSLELSAGQALPVGLIINELTTNACKYAFAYAHHPEINVSCFSDKNHIIIKVADNGPGIANSVLDSKTTSNSFGLKLIRIQVEQLYGSYQFKSESGTIFQMQFNAA